MNDRPHLLLVGGGHASVALLKRAETWIRDRRAVVTLLSEHPTLYYSGMVPEYLGGVYASDDIQIDLQAWCEQAGITWHAGRAVSLDPDAQIVTTAEGRDVSYDLVVFDIGARTAGASSGDRRVTVKPLHHIESVEQFVRSAEQGTSPTKRLTIVGGGAAGVEMALNISARVPPRRLVLTLIEQGPSLLPSFPSGLQAHVTERLTGRDVSVRTRSTVTAATDGSVRLSDGTEVPGDLVVWATGATGQPIFQEAGLPCDARGFVHVRPSLQCADAPRVFAAGDCAVVEGYETLARVGVHAVKQGPLLADNVASALQALHDGRPPDQADLRAFRPYVLAPLILSTGTGEGVWTAGPLWLRGRWALRLKHFVDLRWIDTYQLSEADRWSLGQMLHARSAQSAGLRPSSPPEATTPDTSTTPDT